MPVRMGKRSGCVARGNPLFLTVIRPAMMAVKKLKQLANGWVGMPEFWICGEE